MNGWVKFFIDGETEEGYDSWIDQGQASWRRGRLDGLCGVVIHQSSRSYGLWAGEGDWWQEDVMVASVGGQPETHARRARRKITEDDVGKWVELEVGKNGDVRVTLRKE
jgi:hypothetical protein